MRDTHGDVSLEESGGIVKRLPSFFVPINEPHEERSSADFFVERLHHLNVFGNEAGLEEKILRRIPGNSELRHENKVGSGRIQAFVGLQDFVGVAAKISDSRVDLSKTDFHASAADYALGQPEQRLLRGLVTRICLERSTMLIASI